MRMSALFSVFLVSAILSVVLKAEAQTVAVDKRAVVRAAFENFISTVYFLSGSDRFLNDLTPEEKIQFELLGHKLIPHQYRLGPVQPGEFRTSRLISNRLKFSDKNQDFILKEGEPVRTAKMDGNGDIWYNLNIINNPSSDFSLLKAYQIFYHEFGHLIQASEGKDQEAIDRIAAKIRKHLQSSVREIEVTPTLQVTTHLLPQLLYNGMEIDYQPEPIVIITKDGVAYEGRLPNVGFAADGYATLRPDDFHAIKRVAITPAAEMDGERLLLKWSIEVGHFFVQSDELNYIELFSNLEKVRDRLPFEPFYNSKDSFKLVDLNDLAQDMPLRSFTENIVPSFSPAKLKWFEPLAYKGLKGGQVEYEGVVEVARDIREVAILGRRKFDAFHFPGTFEHLTGNIYRMKFSIPTETTTADSIFLTGLSIEGPGRESSSGQGNISDAFLLNEQIEVRPSASRSVSTLLPAKTTEIWDGRSWISPNDISEDHLSTDEIRMRFHIKGATTQLNHIEINWLAQEEVQQNGKTVGAKWTSFLEVIPSSRLRQSFNGGILTMEFTAKRGSAPIPNNLGKGGLTLKDTVTRAFLQAQFVDQNLNIAYVPNKLTSRGWRSAFKLNPRPQASSARSGVKTCEGLFSAAQTY